MARDYVNYGTGITATVTLTSLAHTTARECTAIINDTAANQYTDFVAVVTLKTVTGTHASDMACYAHMYAGTGTTFDSPVTGTDAAVTVDTGWNLKGPFIINFGTSATGLMSRTNTFLISQAFGGEVPAKFGLVIENKTGLALSATASDCNVAFVPVFHTVT